MRLVLQARKAADAVPRVQLIPLPIATTPDHAAGVGGGDVRRGFVVHGWAAVGAADEDGDQGAQRGQAGGDDAHAGLGGGPDGGVDVVPG